MSNFPQILTVNPSEKNVKIIFPELDAILTSKNVFGNCS
jgi:hypothetical protein